METLHPFHLGLLRVNRQINEEATPVFYGGNNFVPDADPVYTIRSFKTLPTLALHTITKLTITQELLMADDGPSRECWSGNIRRPLTKGSPAMTTPMGAFLATCMPKLTDIFLYMPFGGSGDWYCDRADEELCKLLCHGKIQRLHYVFMGKSVAKALRTASSSDACLATIYHRRLGVSAAEVEYELSHPQPDATGSRDDEEHELFRQELGQWFDAKDRYADAHVRLFA